MRIYRIETEHGTGPYVGGEFSSWCSEDKLGLDEHLRLVERHQYHPAAPSPEEDKICWFGRDHVFGFSSKRQLRAWFTGKARKLMHEAGFSVSVYEIDPKAQGKNVVRGKRQVAFYRPAATVVDSLSLLEF